jgi:hypothetical protein
MFVGKLHERIGIVVDVFLHAPMDVGLLYVSAFAIGEAELSEGVDVLSCFPSLPLHP